MPSMHTLEGRIAIKLGMLPASAQRKYRQLQAQRDDAAALTRTAFERERVTEDHLRRVSHRHATALQSQTKEFAAQVATELEAARLVHEAATDERMKRNAMRANADQVLAQIDSRFLASDVVMLYRERRSPAPKPAAGQTIADAVRATRGEVMRTMTELAAIRAAPPTVEEAKQQITEQILDLARQGGPHIVVSADAHARLVFLDQPAHANPGQPLTTPAGAVGKMLAWLFCDRMIAAASAAVEQTIQGPGLTREARAESIAFLTSRLGELEHQEEVLVEQALTAGVEVHRRPNASPLAVLNIEEDLPAPSVALAEAASA